MSTLAPVPETLDVPLSPEEVGQIRRLFARYIVEAMPSIRRGLLGQEHWTTQRLGLFKTVSARVIPDLSASFTEVHHTHDDLTRLSRTELERIASGIAHAPKLVDAGVAGMDSQIDLDAPIHVTEALPTTAEPLPDPDDLVANPNPRLVRATFRPLTPGHKGYHEPKPAPKKTGRPRRHPTLSAQQLKRKIQKEINARFPLEPDGVQLKLTFSHAHHYYAYPPTGGEPIPMGPDPKEWCRQHKFDPRAVARIAHGYPNVSRGIPYIPKVVRGWSFSHTLKGNHLPRDERHGDPKVPPPSILPRSEESKHG
jgi:hypothetical protein